MTSEIEHFLKSVFDSVDGCENGLLPREKLGEVLRFLGYAPTEDNLEEYDQVLPPGPLTFEVLCNLLQKFPVGVADERSELEAAFEEIFPGLAYIHPQKLITVLNSGGCKEKIDIMSPLFNLLVL